VSNHFPHHLIAKRVVFSRVTYYNTLMMSAIQFHFQSKYFSSEPIDFIS